MLQTGASTNKKTKTATEKIVVVGNGMVSHRFCRSFRAVNQETQLTVLGKEPEPAYDRVNLTRMVTTPRRSALYLDPVSWYENHRIELKLGTEVTAINCGDKTVVTADGTRIAYERLVIATGSKPWVPPIKGARGERVFLYRTMEDIDRIRSAAERTADAAVIGGGLLGLEAAHALRDLGLNVTVVEIADFLMPQQLDWQAGVVLKQEVSQRGITVRTSCQTELIRTDELGRKVLRFTSGQSLRCDFVVISAGIQPETDFLEGTPIARNPNGAVQVDAFLKTNQEAVYAIGECAAVKGRVYGLVTPGYEMADTLARRLNREKAQFSNGDQSTRLKVMDVDVSVLGDYLRSQAGFQTQTYSKITPNGTSVYRKLILNRNRLAGAMIVGAYDRFPALQDGVAAEARLSRSQLRAFKETGELFPDMKEPVVCTWKNEVQVCNCMKVSKGGITAAIADGCDTVEAIGIRTFAGTVCGSCQPLLKDLLGAPTGNPRVPASVGVILATSLLALAGAAATVLAPPLAYAESVEQYWYKVDQLWRSGMIKQITGYSLFALCLLAMSLSVRKRFKALKKGAYPVWRMIHTVTGLACLLVLFLHTGFHLGANFNALLIFVFALLNLLGGLTGVFTALESRVQARVGAFSRRLKPLLAWAHILCFWPIPILVLLHVFSVYYW